MTAALGRAAVLADRQGMGITEFTQTTGHIAKVSDYEHASSASKRAEQRRFIHFMRCETLFFQNWGPTSAWGVLLYKVPWFPCFSPVAVNVAGHGTKSCTMWNLRDLVLEKQIAGSEEDIEIICTSLKSCSEFMCHAGMAFLQVAEMSGFFSAYFLSYLMPVTRS